MSHHCSHNFDFRILQCCIFKHNQHYNRAGTWKFALRSSSTRDLNQKWAWRERVWHQTALQAGKAKKLLAVLYGQICTADMCLLSADSRTLLLREGASRFVFLWEEKDPLVLSRKCTRETLEDEDASTNLLFMLVGCLNKHQAPDMALLRSCQLSPSTTSKIKIKKVFWRASILITVPGIYPNEDKNMFCMQVSICMAQWRKAIAIGCHAAVVEELEVIY